MNTTRATRTYLTAGVAALGAGAMALSAVQPVPEQTALVPHRVVTDLGTALLASSFDPITPWVDTITTSIDNIAGLITFALDKPFPILQTVVANLQTYLGELTSGNAGLIPGQIFGNIEKFFTAPWDEGEVAELPIGPTGSGSTSPIPAGTYLSSTTPATPVGAISPLGLNQTINQFMVDGLLTTPCQTTGDCGIWTTLGAATTFLGSYGAGALLGLLGPVLSPVAALINSVTAIVDAIQASDFIGAINELVNIPANLVNGILNGALLNLTPLVNQIVGPGSLPVDEIGLRFGGLITGPMPTDGSLAPDSPNPPTEFSGGTGFDPVYVRQGQISFPGLPVGPIGSLIGMGQYLSDQLLVTPPAAPAAQTAAAVESAPVEVVATVQQGISEVSADAPAAVEASNPAPVEAAAGSAPAETATQAQAGGDSPARAGVRASRTTPAATDAGTTKKSSTRASAASRR